MPRSTLIDIDATLVHETAKAYLLDVGGPNNIWVPKEPVENNGDGTFTMPRRLAEEKGLV